MSTDSYKMQNTAKNKQFSMYYFTGFGALSSRHMMNREFSLVFLNSMLRYKASLLKRAGLVLRKDQNKRYEKVKIKLAKKVKYFIIVSSVKTEDYQRFAG